MRTRVNKSGLPCASFFETYRCGHCPHLHVILKDEDEEPFAVLIISNAQAIEIGLQGEEEGEETMQ